MYRQEEVDRLNFQNDRTFYKEINPKSAIESLPLICQRYRNFPLIFQLPLFELCCQAGLISYF